MAAGLLITRILLIFFLIVELHFSSAFPAGFPDAWKVGTQPERNGYRTSDRLYNVQSLRQPNKNMQSNNHLKPQHKYQGSLRDLSQMHKKTLPHQPQEMSPLQPPLQTNHLPIDQRGFEITLDVPVIAFLGQNKISGSSTKGSDYGQLSAAPHHYRQSNVRIQSGLNIPSSAILENVNLNPGSNFVPQAKRTGSAQDLKLPLLNLGDILLLKPGHHIDLKWPILDADTGQQIKQTSPRKQPTDGKVTPSSWHSRQLNPPTGQGWGSQKPGMDRPPSLPISKYPEQPVKYSSHMSLPRRDYGKAQTVQHDPTKLHISQSPLQYSRVPGSNSHLNIDGNYDTNRQLTGPSRIHIQSHFMFPDRSYKGSTKKRNEEKNYQETSNPFFKLSFSVPLQMEPANLALQRHTHLPDVKSQSSSFVGTKPQKSSWNGSNKPLKPYTAHRETQWMTFESVSKYPEHSDSSAHTSLLRKDYDKDQTVRLNPSQRVPSSYDKTQAKPYGNSHVHGVSKHSVGSLLTFASKQDYSKFEPSEHVRNKERLHQYRSQDILSLDHPNWEVATRKDMAQSGSHTAQNHNGFKQASQAQQTPTSYKRFI